MFHLEAAGLLLTGDSETVCGIAILDLRRPARWSPQIAWFAGGVDSEQEVRLAVSSASVAEVWWSMSAEGKSSRPPFTDIRLSSDLDQPYGVMPPAS